MKLLILAGAGSPDNPLYASLYRLLEYRKTVVRQRQTAKFGQSIRFKPVVRGAVHKVTAEAPAPVFEAYIEARSG